MASGGMLAADQPKPCWRPMTHLVVVWVAQINRVAPVPDDVCLALTLPCKQPSHASGNPTPDARSRQPKTQKFSMKRKRKRRWDCVRSIRIRARKTATVGP